MMKRLEQRLREAIELCMLRIGYCVKTREVSGTGDMAGVKGWTKSQPSERKSRLDRDL